MLRQATYLNAFLINAIAPLPSRLTPSISYTCLLRQRTEPRPSKPLPLEIALSHFATDSSSRQPQRGHRPQRMLKSRLLQILELYNPPICYPQSYRPFITSSDEPTPGTLNRKEQVPKQYLMTPRGFIGLQIGSCPRTTSQQRGLALSVNGPWEPDALEFSRLGWAGSLASVVGRKLSVKLDKDRLIRHSFNHSDFENLYGTMTVLRYTATTAVHDFGKGLCG